jgi:lipocalin
VLELDTNEYKYAMVGSSLKYLWILSREPMMDNAMLSSLIDKAQEYVFDASKLTFTPQERWTRQQPQSFFARVLTALSV